MIKYITGFLIIIQSFIDLVYFISISLFIVYCTVGISLISENQQILHTNLNISKYAYEVDTMFVNIKYVFKNTSLLYN